MCSIIIINSAAYAAHACCVSSQYSWVTTINYTTNGAWLTDKTFKYNLQFYTTAIDSTASRNRIMGSVMGKVMDENMKKQQEFMVKNQSVMVSHHVCMLVVYYIRGTLYKGHHFPLILALIGTAQVYLLKRCLHSRGSIVH